ncbi:MAG TPA: SDR family oxidoreductase [Rhodanobacteraceae bacterium]|jgi:short-subunit dehydrogenase|nr:SDR family oxidoreductase [Rhodanobacteraceae bacterium]
MPRNELVLVTGASSGIGRELARCFAADGCALVLSARRRAELDELATELRAKHASEVAVITADLAAPDGVQALLAGLQERNLSPDVLVNNAGFGARGEFTGMSADRIGAMLAVNVDALTMLARALLPAMRERKRGGLLNVASTAAFQPGPYMATYYASKAYVLSLSEALYVECKPDNVTVTCLCPGATATGFAAEADMTGSLLFRLGAMDAVSVARAAHRGFRRGRAIVVTGWRNKLGAQSVRVSPRAVVRKLVAKLQR